MIYKNPIDKKDIETFVENAKRLNKAVALAGINKMGCN
ncbi:MAG TPA: Cof-type HAD-IIB family hydrolase, partial [Erysipelotrichaceae bacterium]|nr:Cof-type HAD-IIB family hydrolase [Erysipelotrichaceae bacterium]